MVFTVYLLQLSELTIIAMYHVSGKKHNIYDNNFMDIVMDFEKSKYIL